MVRQFGTPALDVGCATGRIVLDFLAHGLDMDGVDNSPEMLALAQQKAAALNLRPNLYQQSMETLDLPRRYRTIVVPSSSLQLVIEPSAALAAMRRFYDHLLPGGALVMSLMTLWQVGDPLESTWTKEVTRPSDGATVRRTAWSRYHPETEVEDTHDVYEISLHGQVLAREAHSRASATRSYTQAQALFEAAGFREVTVRRAFTTEPATPADTLFTVLGVR